MIAHIEKAPQVVAVEVDDIEEPQFSEKSGRKGGNNKLWATLAGCLAILAMASWIVTYIVEENTDIVQKIPIRLVLCQFISMILLQIRCKTINCRKVFTIIYSMASTCRER